MEPLLLKEKTKTNYLSLEEANGNQMAVPQSIGVTCIEYILQENPPMHRMVDREEDRHKRLWRRTHDEVLFSILTYSRQSRDISNRVGHLFVKLIFTGLCYYASTTAINPAEKNFDDKTLQILFASGDVFAWGTLSAYCILTLYDHMLEGPSLSAEKKKAWKVIAYWVTVFALGLITEIPTMYVNWYYNRDNPLLYIFAPVFSSFFSALSVDEFFQELSNSNHLIRCRGSVTEREWHETHHRLCNWLEGSLEEVSKGMPLQQKRKILALSQSTNRKQDTKEVLLDLLKLGQQNQGSNPNEHVSNVETVISVLSLFFSAGSPIMDGILTYKAYHEIVDNNSLTPLIIFIAVVPGIYLQVKLTKDFYYGGYSKTVKVIQADQRVHCRTALLLTALKLILLLAITAFSLSEDVTVARDNVGFDSFFDIYVTLSLVSTMAILVMTSMYEVAQRVSSIFHGRTQAGAEHNSLIERVACLEEYFSNLSSEEFVSLVHEMGLQGRDCLFLKLPESTIDGTTRIELVEEENEDEEKNLLANYNTGESESSERRGVSSVEMHQEVGNGVP